MQSKKHKIIFRRNHSYKRKLSIPSQKMPPSHLLLYHTNNSPTATLYESGTCLPPIPPLVNYTSSCSNYDSDENSMIERKESLAMLVGSAPRIPLLDNDEYSDCISFSSTIRHGSGWKPSPRQSTYTVDYKYYSYHFYHTQ